jgi:hypothetical protein
MQLAPIVAALLTRRFHFTCEAELQAGLTSVLVDELGGRREVHLSGADRIDFLIGRVGIEVKTGGSTSALLRQLQRYAGSTDVDELLVITTLHRLANACPPALQGKPVRAVHVGGLT